MITKSTAGNNYFSKLDSPGSRANGEAVFEAKGYYVATGGETFIQSTQLIGDTISWNSSDYAKIRVLRSTGGEQIPRFPGMPSGWGIDCSSPPTITFSTPLQLGEVVYAVNPTNRASLLRPEYPNFYTEQQTVTSGSSFTTYYLSKPAKLTYKGGQNRGRSVNVILDGKIQTLNPLNGATGGDYKENANADGDTFSSITFNSAPGLLAGADLSLEFDYKGFYDADGVSQVQLNTLTDNFNSTYRVVDKAQSIVTGLVTLGTTTIPFDGTIPQITGEGDPISGFSITYTPKYATSTIQVKVVAMLSSSGTGSPVLALFKDGAANAVASQGVYTGISYTGQIELLYAVSPGSFTPIAFTVRAGFSAAGTTYLNSYGATNNLGNTISSWIIVEEILNQ